mmetsp:Transcript_28250/g.41782  ORF Transcript_28250/g.41782 Transcript_28250/m.41782 type:complete len:162 (-) Transcript_28250:4123-4608(-)
MDTTAGGTVSDDVDVSDLGVVNPGEEVVVVVNPPEDVEVSGAELGDRGMGAVAELHAASGVVADTVVPGAATVVVLPGDCSVDGPGVEAGDVAVVVWVVGGQDGVEEMLVTTAVLTAKVLDGSHAGSLAVMVGVVGAGDGSVVGNVESVVSVVVDAHDAAS